MSTRVIFPLFGSGGGGGDMSLYATGITMTMDNNYVISAQLTNSEGELIGTEQTIDLPLESVVVSGSYDSQTQSLILTLQNGNTITIPVSGLISGLQAEITAQNPLSADLISDGTNNKVFTAAEKTKLAATRRVIDLTDMTQAELANFYTNYATLLGQNTYTINGYSFTTTTFQNSLYGTVLLIEYNSTYKDQDAGASTGTIDVGISVAYVLQDGTLVQVGSGTYNVPKTSSLATVATTGSYPDLHNRPTIPTVNDATITLQDDGGTTIDSFTLNQSSNKTITIPSSGGGGSNQWFGTQIQFDSLSEYDDDTDYFISDKIDYNTDIKHKPNLSVYATKIEVNTKNTQQDTEIAGKLSGHFMTQQEFDALGNNVPEGENYFIQGDTVQMVVTFTDQSTATYNVVVD